MKTPQAQAKTDGGGNRVRPAVRKKSARKRSRKAPGCPYQGGRRYPRRPVEVGERAGSTALAALAPRLDDLRQQALDDLGGEDNVTALRREILGLALLSESVALALAAEIAEKAAVSIAAGHTPHPSRYRATVLLPGYINSAAQLFRRVGLNRRAVTVGLDSYLQNRGDQGDPPSADGAES